MTKREACNGKPYARNPHVRFDEGKVASTATSRRGSLLYKKLLMMIGAAGCLALEAFANTAATYTAGVTSLADGKITFEYDDSDNITKMWMKPDYGEKLTLTGGTLSFADGAQIITSQDGTPVIANTISAEGSLLIGGVTNMSWSGSVFDRYTNPNWQTVLTNTRLDDIVPVYSTGGGRRGTTTLTFYPYWIVREGDTLRAELQAINASNLMGLHLELKQDGNDIKAKVINGGYLAAAYTNNLGQSMFEYGVLSATTNNNVAKQYGFTQLTFGRRCETRDYIGNLLSDAYDTVVAPNTSLEDVEILYAACNNKHVLSGWTDDTIYPYHVTRSDGYLYAQMSILDGYAKCVKIRLAQAGNDVVARVMYARYATTNDVVQIDNDFDITYDREWKIITQEKFNAGTNQGYGIDTLALRIKAKDKLTFAVSGTMNLNMPISGQDAEVTFEAASATATVNATTNNVMTDSTYVIKGDAEHVMKFYATPANRVVVLPEEVDVYGVNTELHIYGYNAVNHGGSAGSSEIRMHPGSKLIAENKQVPFHPSKSKIVLKGAMLSIAFSTQTNGHLGYLTLEDGSTVSGNGYLCAGYNCTAPLYSVTGTIASTNECKLLLWGSNNLTLHVDDVDKGYGADFIMRGDVANNNSSGTAILIKKGAGTMLMNGKFSNTANPNRIVEGEIRLGVSSAVVSGSSFSLEGGKLGLASGTANTLSSVSVVADSAIAFESGATLNVGTLSLGDDVETLSITSADGEYPITVTNPIDAESISKIRLNGKRVIQAGDGRLVRRGLIIAIL